MVYRLLHRQTVCLWLFSQLSLIGLRRRYFVPNWLTNSNKNNFLLISLGKIEKFCRWPCFSQGFWCKHILWILSIQLLYWGTFSVYNSLWIKALLQMQNLGKNCALHFDVITFQYLPFPLLYMTEENGRWCLKWFSTKKSWFPFLLC